MVALFAAISGLAVATGLASGAAEPEGWRFAIVIGALVGYMIAEIVAVIAGIQLARDAFRKDDGAIDVPPAITAASV